MSYGNNAMQHDAVPYQLLTVWTWAWRLGGGKEIGVSVPMKPSAPPPASFAFNGDSTLPPMLISTSQADVREAVDALWTTEQVRSNGLPSAGLQVKQDRHAHSWGAFEPWTFSCRTLLYYCRMRV